MKIFRHFLPMYLPLGYSGAILWGLLCPMGLWLLVKPETSVAQNVVQRDPQALTILAQTIAAGGGQELLASIQDYTESGTVTYNWIKPIAGKVTVKSRGLHQFRIDADLPKGTRTTIINGDSGSLKEEDGQTRLIYRQSANDLTSLSLPYLPLIAAMEDPTTTIIYEGLVMHNGASVHDIRLQRSHIKEQASQGNRGEREASDLYIDPKTLLTTAISDRIYFGSDQHNVGVSQEVIYSHYQDENGVTAPLTIVENVQNVTAFTMNLDQFTFNVGLTDSDFAQ